MHFWNARLDAAIAVVDTANHGVLGGVGRHDTNASST
jgi:hypothetical protein